MEEKENNSKQATSKNTYGECSVNKPPRGRGRARRFISYPRRTNYYERGRGHDSFPEEYDRPKCNAPISRSRNKFGRGRRGGRSLCSTSTDSRKITDKHVGSLLLSTLAKGNNIGKEEESKLIMELQQHANNLQFHHLPDLFKLLNANNRLKKKEFLQKVTESSFFKEFLQHIIQENFPIITVIMQEQLNEFLMDFFTVMINIVHLLGRKNFESLIATIENSLLASCQATEIQPEVRQLYDALVEDRDMNDLTTGVKHLTVKKDSQITKREVLKFENMQPPNNFRNLSVIPTPEDLFYDSREVFVRANKVKGGFKHVNDYLDIQFRLMREDFLSPLREGIGEYFKFSKSSSSVNRKLNNVWLYTNVRIGVSVPMVHSGIVYQIHFQKNPRIDWNQTKRLIYGSLLCFSSDNFESIYFGIVSEREVKELQKGYFYVQFVDSIPCKDASYIMLESVVYYEAYRHVLGRLKQVKSNAFPFSKYFVYCSQESSWPFYMSMGYDDLMFDLNIIRDTSYSAKVNKYFLRIFPNRRDILRWPNKSILGLDNSQMKALKSALTNELVLIQGPPGTGKTYIGLKIVKVLCQSLQYYFPNFGPILIVCYTNHALDQFLEGIRDFLFSPGDIVRIGGRSQSEVMQNCSIFNLKQKKKVKKRIPSEISASMKYINKEIYTLRDNIIASQQKIQSSFTRVIGTNNLLPYMLPSHKNHFLSRSVGKFKGNYRKESIHFWLTNDDRNENDIIAPSDETAFPTEEEETTEEDIGEFLENFQFIKAKDDALCETEQRMVFDEEYVKAESLRRRIENCDAEENISENEQWRTVHSANKYQYLVTGKLTQSTTLKMTSTEVSEIDDDPWSLNIDDRWRLYFHWVSKYHEELEASCKQMEEEFECLAQQRKDLRFEEDRHIMSGCRVIGMTTTGAARYGHVLTKLGCKIIVVEEAAEVLESHIITSLNSKCEQLILIGDHKQLRPSPAVYLLAKKYNLEVSLFERLVNNGVHYDTLQYQHRMRPDIADIMRFIYPNLRDHESILKYENIRGVSFNLFFLDHDNREERLSDCTSYFNTFEADYAQALCRHFLKNGYQPTDITILTLYSAQLSHIKEKMNSEEFKDVILTSVDNYQGEENEIIILSLVRSNEKDYIGFLGVDNRVCVAMSRARNGLYILGNSNLLSRSSKSQLWRDIINHLSKRDQLGKFLPLKCQIHQSDSPVLAFTAKEFALVPDGGCQKKCLKILNCGHQCRLYCHPVDQEHEQYKCLINCDRVRSCGHQCNKLCYQDCYPCKVLVDKEMPHCKHQQTMACSEEPENFACQFPIVKMIPSCSHNQTMACGESPDYFMCQYDCEKCLPCGHQCDRRCGELCWDYCRRKFIQKFRFCGHKVEINCGEDPEMMFCFSRCNKTMLCGHRCKLFCGDCSNGRLHGPCKEKCNRLLACGHACQGICCDSCPPCSKLCQNHCPHNSCSKTCEQVCTPCKEKLAPQQCPHQKCDITGCCDGITSEINICNERCSSDMLCQRCNSKYKCIGLCGEQCPEECPSCDERYLKSLLVIQCPTKYFVNNYEEARFITLWKCRHTFEVTYLDKWMEMKSKTVTIRGCPKCSATVDTNSTRRYLRGMKKYDAFLQIIKRQVFKKDSSELQKEKIGKILMTLTNQKQDLQQMATHFQLASENEFSEKLIKALLEDSVNARHNIFITETSLLFYQELYKIFNRIQMNTLDIKKTCDFHLYRSLQYFFLWLDPFTRQFTEFEIRQTLFELERIRSLVFILSSRTLTSQYFNQLTDCRDEKELQKIRSNLRLKEITTVKCALTLESKNWRICQENHLYITNVWRNLERQIDCPQCSKL